MSAYLYILPQAGPRHSQLSLRPSQPGPASQAQAQTARPSQPGLSQWMNGQMDEGKIWTDKRISMNLKKKRWGFG